MHNAINRELIVGELTLHPHEIGQSRAVDVFVEHETATATGSTDDWKNQPYLLRCTHSPDNFP